MEPDPRYLGKICLICGEDCSKRPRTRTKRGFYYCLACYNEAKAKLEAHLAETVVDEPAIEDSPESEESAVDQADSVADTDALAETKLDESAIEVAVEEEAVDPRVLSADESATDMDLDLRIIPCMRCGGAVPEFADFCVHCGLDLDGTHHVMTQGEYRLERLAARWQRTWSRWRRPSYLFWIVTGSMAGLSVLSHYTEGLSLFYILVVALLTALVLAYLFYDAFRADWRYAVRSLLIPGYLIWYVFMVSRSRYLQSAFCANFVVLLLIPFASSQMIFPN